MDNASKALIMAGAVLIAVALVGLGVYLYRSATSTIESGANTVDEASLVMNNQIVTKYGATGKKLSAKQARLLAEDVARANNQEKLFVTVSLDGAEIFGSDTSLDDAMTAIKNMTGASFTIEYDTDSNGAINTLGFTTIN